MAYFPIGYFPANAPVAGTAYNWLFERVRPAARQCKVRVPAASTEFHIFRISAQPATGSALSAGQIAAIGVDVGYAKKQVDGSYADAVWLQLSQDIAQNAALPFAVEFKIFRVSIGPSANNALVAGVYQTLLRAHTAPQTIKRLANLEVV